MRSRNKLKNCISTTTMLMAIKLGSMMTYFEWLLPIKSHNHIIIWSCKITWQTKISPVRQCLWLPILAGWDIQWGVSFHKVTRSFDHVALNGHVNYFSCCITTTTRPMDTKRSKVGIFYKKLRPIKLHNTLNTWHVRSHDKSKLFYLHYHNTYSDQTWQSGYVQ